LHISYKYQAESVNTCRIASVAPSCRALRILLLFAGHSPYAYDNFKTLKKKKWLH
jgi:hypothetical protein